MHRVSPNPGRLEFDEREFRDAVGHYASGITAITGFHSGAPLGVTCQSFFSVSLVPALVSFSISVSSRTYPQIRETGRFCVNMLTRSQRHVSVQFASRASDKWSGISWRTTKSGNPIIDGCLGWVDCSLEAEHPAGDHLIVVGRVCELFLPETETAEFPLLYFKGRYCTLDGSLAHEG
jgi:3-hydroxy-9,10-secoandrosta-1,3,5(10)-triene-9,17-dione monooxygenase reductase component